MDVLSSALREGNVFTRVCHLFCPQGGLHPGGGWTNIPPIRYYGIQSTSGRYAPYWNAFLLLNIFTELTEFIDKNICHYSKRAQTCHLLCKRPGRYHSTSKTHVRDRIFTLLPIHALVIYQIP